MIILNIIYVRYAAEGFSKGSYSTLLVTSVLASHVYRCNGQCSAPRAVLPSVYLYNSSPLYVMCMCTTLSCTHTPIV